MDEIIFEESTPSSQSMSEDNLSRMWCWWRNDWCTQTWTFSRIWILCTTQWDDVRVDLTSFFYLAKVQYKTLDSNLCYCVKLVTIITNKLDPNILKEVSAVFLEVFKQLPLILVDLVGNQTLLYSGSPMDIQRTASTLASVWIPFTTTLTWFEYPGPKQILVTEWVQRVSKSLFLF